MERGIVGHIEPPANFSINGDLIVGGSLTVGGNFTTINTEIVDTIKNPSVIFSNEVEFKGDVNFEGGIKLDGIDMKNVIVEQSKEINELKRKLEEIYYAPGMPGFLQAQESFEANKKRRIE